MIAANGVTARFLAAKGLPSFRRVVRTPQRWDRIRELAADQDHTLPEAPDARALEAFLAKARERDLLRFPDLSLSSSSSLARASTLSRCRAVQRAATSDSRSGTILIRPLRTGAFPDLITQRLLKSALSGRTLPYTNEELSALAKHCTEKEDAAKKVERQVRKSAAAMLLEHRIGEQFDAIVTGAADKGTWSGSSIRPSRDGWRAV